MREPPGGGASTAVPGFLPPFRLPAFASWVILRPLGNRAFLTVGLPAAIWPAGPQRGCRVAHEQDATGQGAPFTPGTVVRSRPAIILRPAPAALPRPVPTAPLEHPTCGGHLHETSSGVHSRSPITPGRPDAAPGREAAASRRSSPRLPPPDGTRAASASSPGFAPRSYPRRTPGRRRANAHWPGYCASGLSRTSSSASHLNSCTLTSHVVAGGLQRHDLDAVPAQLAAQRADRAHPGLDRPDRCFAGRRAGTGAAAGCIPSRSPSPRRPRRPGHGPARVPRRR